MKKKMDYGDIVEFKLLMQNKKTRELFINYLFINFTLQEIVKDYNRMSHYNKKALCDQLLAEQLCYTTGKEVTIDEVG